MNTELPLVHAMAVTSDALSLMLAPEPGARSGEGWEEEARGGLTWRDLTGGHSDVGGQLVKEGQQTGRAALLLASFQRVFPTAPEALEFLGRGRSVFRGRACLASYFSAFKKVEFVRGELKPCQRIRLEGPASCPLQGEPSPGGPSDLHPSADPSMLEGSVKGAPTLGRVKHHATPASAPV